MNIGLDIFVCGTSDRPIFAIPQDIFQISWMEQHFR